MSLSPSLSLPLSLSLSLSLCLSLTLSLSFAPSLSLSVCVCVCVSFPLFLTQSLFLSSSLKLYLQLFNLIGLCWAPGTIVRRLRSGNVDCRSSAKPLVPYPVGCSVMPPAMRHRLAFETAVQLPLPSPTVLPAHDDGCNAPADDAVSAGKSDSPLRMC